MIESVLSQTYSNWELCISDGASKEKHVKEILDCISSLHREHINRGRLVGLTKLYFSMYFSKRLVCQGYFLLLRGILVV